MSGSLSDGWGCPDGTHAFAPFQLGNYRLEIGGASSVVSVFSDLRQPFVGKVRALREGHPICGGAVRYGPPAPIVIAISEVLAYIVIDIKGLIRGCAIAEHHSERSESVRRPNFSRS
jgi:hypothetical protein